MRAGASAEIIAAENGWPLDKVQRYAEPPLAERAFIAERAQQVEMRRTGGRVRLADSVALVVGPDAARGITWDAYRRDDGRWIVTASLPSGAGRSSASWTYDPAGPNLHPLDEPARWLMGVSDEPIIDFITDAEVVAAPEPESTRPHLIAVPSIDDDAAVDAPEPVDVEVEVEVEVDAPTGQTTLPVATEPATRDRKQRPKGRRASVPSWDEILFGATRGDDA